MGVWGADLVSLVQFLLPCWRFGWQDAGLRCRCGLLQHFYWGTAWHRDTGPWPCWDTCAQPALRLQEVQVWPGSMWPCVSLSGHLHSVSDWASRVPLTRHVWPPPGQAERPRQVAPPQAGPRAPEVWTRVPSSDPPPLPLSCSPFPSQLLLPAWPHGAPNPASHSMPHSGLHGWAHLGDITGGDMDKGTKEHQKSCTCLQFCAQYLGLCSSIVLEEIRKQRWIISVNKEIQIQKNTGRETGNFKDWHKGKLSFWNFVTIGSWNLGVWGSFLRSLKILFLLKLCFDENHDCNILEFLEKIINFSSSGNCEDRWEVINEGWEWLMLLLLGVWGLTWVWVIGRWVFHCSGRRDPQTQVHHFPGTLWRADTCMGAAQAQGPQARGIHWGPWRPAKQQEGDGGSPGSCCFPSGPQASFPVVYICCFWLCGHPSGLRSQLESLDCME